MDFALPILLQSRPGIPIFWWLGLVGSLTALIAAFYFYRDILSNDEGTPAMIEIAQAVRDGAMAYLSAQYRTIIIVFAALFVIFAILAVLGVQSWFVTVAFLTAGFFSGAAGFVGMRAATNSSARTANAAREGLNGGLRIAFRGGAVMGLSVVGFALLDMSIWFVILYYIFDLPIPDITAFMLSAAVGAAAGQPRGGHASPIPSDRRALRESLAV